MIEKERRISLDMIVGDKDPEVGLRVEIQKDRDVVFWFYDFGSEQLKDVRIEFCTFSFGGGLSFNTWDATHKLYEAMRKDNDNISMELTFPSFEQTRDQYKSIYKRVGDMGPNDYIQVLLQKDGDIVLTGFSFHRSYRGEKPKLKSEISIEFSASGGRSPHTRRALLKLCLAIEKDNKENPIEG